MSRMSSRARLITIAVFAVFACTGCGVSAESSPHSLTAGSDPTVAPPAGTVTRLSSVFLVRVNGLVVAHRPVPVPVTLARIVQALLSGPTSAEAERGLRSAIPATLSLHKLSEAGGTVTIDFSQGLGAIDSTEQSLALAQLVYTVTERSGVNQLRVLVDGQSVEVPRADGTLTNGNLSRDDYASLLVG